MDDLNVNSCRICFAANPCVPLFDDREEFNVASLLESAINIKVQVNEHISSLICSKCFEMINTSVKLKQSVELAEERWSNFFLYVWILTRKEDIDQNIEHIKREEDISINNDDNTEKEEEYPVEEISKENPDPLELIKREIAGSDNNDSKSVGDYIQDAEVEPKLDDGISNGSIEKSRKHEAKNKGRRCDHQSNHRFKCLECGKSFKLKSSLYHHLTVHTGVKNHNCEICNKSFLHKYLLRRHFRIHSGEKPFKCKYCDMRFTHSSTLALHTLRKHLKNNDQFKPKGHACTKCDKIFVTPSSLRDHFRIHTGEKPFECKHCDLKFTHSSSLASHTRCKHPKNNDQVKSKEKAHPCTKCDKTFLSQSKLRDHFRMHTGEKPFECKYCHLKFTRSSSLAAHTRHKHLKNNDHFKSKKNAHPCTKCDKTFLYLSSLRVHFRIHTGEKTFDCKYCHMKFTRSRNLETHTRKHLKNNDQFNKKK